MVQRAEARLEGREPDLESGPGGRAWRVGGSGGGTSEERVREEGRAASTM